MGRIRGHYEWDDDDLTPGRKREGGLHQNLFDGEGSLKGSARFVPDDRSEAEPLIITETIYVPVEQRRRTREQEELAQAVNDLVSYFINQGIAKAKPYVEQWWRQSAYPALAAQGAKISGRGQARKKTAVAGTVIEPSQEVAEVVGEHRSDMSRAEA